MIQTKTKVYYFDLKTGVRVQKCTTNADVDHNECKMVYDYHNNQFYSFKYANANTRLETFTIDNFKKGGVSFGFAKEFLSNRINQFKQIVHGD